MKRLQVIIVGVIVFIGIVLLGAWRSNGFGSKPTVELIPIDTETWVWVDTDPEKESVRYDIVDRKLDWLIALDGDVEYPFTISARNGTSDRNLGNGVKKIGLSLKPGQGATNSQIRFKRIPK